MRPNLDEYFMAMAMTASLRATCDRRKVGCILVGADGQVLSTGYNGSLPGSPHCDDTSHMMINGHCVRTLHSEMNALMHAAKRGTAVDGATAYVTTFPCHTCFKLLTMAGIRRIVYLDPYEDITHRHDAMALVTDILCEIPCHRRPRLEQYVGKMPLIKFEDGE